MEDSSSKLSKNINSKYPVGCMSAFSGIGCQAVRIIKRKQKVYFHTALNLVCISEISCNVSAIS